MLRVLLMGVLLMLIARAFWRVVDGVIAGASGAPPRGRQPRAAAVKLVRDPVCGTFVAPGSALSLTSGGQTHYFCSEACRAKFRT
jgi:YHS domain-containing protein